MKNIFISQFFILYLPYNKTIYAMSKNELKIEMLLTQLEEASIRLEQYKAKGWSSMVESVTALMARLEDKIDALEE